MDNHLEQSDLDLHEERRDIPAYRKRRGNRRRRIQRDNTTWRPLLGLPGLPPSLLMFLRVLQRERRMLSLSAWEHA